MYMHTNGYMYGDSMYLMYSHALCSHIACYDCVSGDCAYPSFRIAVMIGMAIRTQPVPTVRKTIVCVSSI